MKCILVRHGIAVSREAWLGLDSERPLTSEGVDKTRGAIEGLLNIADQPIHLLSSPYTRALETAQIVEDVFTLEGNMHVCQELVLTHSPMDTFPILTKFPEDACVMCIGHEPHLGQLAAMMISGRYIPGLTLKKAGACAVQFEEKPKIGCGNLDWWVRPGLLRQLANS